MPASLGTRFWFSTLLKTINDFLRRLRCEVLLLGEFKTTLFFVCLKTHIKTIPDDHHWCITASTLAFHLNNRELSVLCRLARFDTSDTLTDGVKNIVSASQHAWGRSAHLHKVLTNRFPISTLSGGRPSRVEFYINIPIEHGVKSGDFIHPHGRHA